MKNKKLPRHICMWIIAIVVIDIWSWLVFPALEGRVFLPALIGLVLEVLFTKSCRQQYGTFMSGVGYIMGCVCMIIAALCMSIKITWVVFLACLFMQMTYPLVLYAIELINRIDQ